MPLPLAPSNLAATVLSSTQIKLSWHDNSTNENGFKIQRSSNGSTWTWLATMGANVTAYSDTTVAINIKYWYRVRAFNSIGTSAWSNTVNATPFIVGIAARYPGDINIQSDPNVVFSDNFESYTSPSQLTTKWTSASRQENLRIATETGNYYSGSQAIEIKLPITATEVSNALHKDLISKQPILYTRVYMKWDAGYSVSGSNHNGITMSGNYPGPGSAPPANGTGFFLFMIQNNIEGNLMEGEASPGYSHYYAYWPKQNSGFGDHWYPTGMVKPNPSQWLTYPAQYPDFKVMPNFLPQRDNWYCYESMVKVNTLGQNDGEIKYWVNGNLVAHFTNLFIRSISSLLIDRVSIGLHASDSQRINKKYYDNLVVAKQYIGPMT